MQWYVLSPRSSQAFTEWVVLWNGFLNDLSAKNTFLLFTTFVRRNSVTIWRQKSCDTRFRRYPSILTLWFHYLFCIFCKFWNQGQTLAYQSKTIENNIMNLYIFWKLKKISNKIWKRKWNNVAMEIYRSLNIVAKVVKNTKISTLS